MKNFFTNLLTVLFLFFLISNSYAQTGVGKLSGKVIDAATKEPLIGANIIVLETQTGAATDINGDYFILNITPGTYAVKVSYVGYAPKTIENVRVVAGITFELNIELSTDFTLEEVVVIDRKFFESKSTNTVKVIDSDQISRLPVKGITNIVSLQSGVVVQEGSGGQDRNATINVRGGRGSEVLYIIDGVPQNNVLTNTSSAQVSDYSIEQISFQVGGYEAKYGQAQSGIINVTTKAGQSYYDIFSDVVSSSFTDDYGYNLYTANLSGPIIPGINDHTLFFSAERGWLKDADPPAITLEFPSINKSSTYREGNESSLWRFTGRTSHNIGDFKLNLGANINLREGRQYIHSYQKNNADNNPLVLTNNYSLSARLSQTLSANSFWNVNFGYRIYDSEQSHPIMKDNLSLYGDSAYFANTFGVTLTGYGTRNQISPITGQGTTTDEYGVFLPYGRIQNLYTKNENDVFSVDGSFTSQIDNHLLEIGGGFNYNTVRNYSIGPVGLRLNSLKDSSEFVKYESQQPSYYGYDIYGNDDSNGAGYYDPYKPVFIFGYLQDRFELDDLVLNLGLRVDYFDTKANILANPTLPYAGGSNSDDFDDGDFVEKDAEFEVSPRIGLGFPVTESTVFHAQFGRFIQIPALQDLYSGYYDYKALITDDSRTINNGEIKSEETIQYEVGFRQLLSDNSALNLSLFYKNIKGLVNTQVVFFQRRPGGALFEYYTPTNTDFGTSKGLALSLDVTRLSYFNVSLQYTYSIAEGTGSSTSSSGTAVFRNVDNEVPKVIAPLDFDQRHTANATVNFYVPANELGWLEMTSATLLLNYSSGRPYTPLDFFDILSGNNGGPSTTGYVNSRFAPGAFRVDMKIEKSFSITDNILITPYLWVQNLFDADNITSVYRSSGDPYSTGWLSTPDGIASSERNGERYTQDYQSLERDPGNFGIPRLIRLGLKLNFTKLSL